MQMRWPPQLLSKGCDVTAFALAWPAQMVRKSNQSHGILIGLHSQASVLA
jgi:hypothetical protein